MPHRTHVLVALLLLCVSVIPRMADRGMFLDGVTYAVLARNLAEGQGTLWHPHYTQTVYPDFHEQPPLGIGLQALAFRIFGDHLYVERLYSFVVGVITLGLMLWVWRTGRATERVAPGWVPATLWLTAPVVSWALANNMLETTQTVFTLFAVGALFESLYRDGAKRALWASISGISIGIAILVKGPVGLFPLAVPWAHWAGALLARVSGDEAERFSRVVLVAAMQVFGTALVLGTVLLNDSAREGLDSYVAQQLRPTLTGARETSPHRLRFAKTTAQEVLPMAVIAGAVLLVSRRRGHPGMSPIDRRRAVTFFLLGCAATVPLAISPKQSGHYVVPAIPMFALGFGSLVAARAESLFQSSSGVRWIRGVAVLLLVATLAATAVRWLVPWRDASRLRDLDRVFSVVPRGSTLHLCPQAQTDWSLHAYAQRLWRASLDVRRTPRHWGIAPADAVCFVPRRCRIVPIGAATLLLYECGRPRVPERRRP